MNEMLRLLLFPHLVVLALGALAAHGQVFFPAGQDHLNYVPNVPGTPAGRLYVGDFFRNGNCHFRKDLPPGKGVTRVEYVLYVTPSGTVVRGVNVTRGEGNVVFYEDSEFERVDKFGNPCLSSAPVAAGARGLSSIPVSNTADSFASTCDGRFAVVVGRGPAATPYAAPVALVDLAAGREVDTLLLSEIGSLVATCDDGESLLVLMTPQTGDRFIRRLRIVNAKLVDTGEILLPPGTGPFRDIAKVYAVPGSKVGVAVGSSGNPNNNPGITTFSISGLQVLDTTPPINGTELSAVVSCAGDRIFLRSNVFVGADGRGRIHGFTLDPVTGAIGDTPFLTTDVAYTVQASTTFGDGLAISRDGTQLIVPETTFGSSAPPTPRTSFLDATTGARVGFFDSFGAAGAYPTLVSTYPCCAGTGLRLGIQRLASGLIQITATGEIGKKYELQKSQNLVAWDKLLEFQMTASPSPYTDTDSQTNSTRFYRLQLIP